MPDKVVAKIATLREEHKGIDRQLKLLRTITSRPPSAQKFGDLADRLGLLLRKHFEDEEIGLYKPLSRRMGRDSPASQMVLEHRTIRRAFEAFRRSSVEYETSRSRSGDVQRLLKKLQEQVSMHLEKEEKVLFWLADLKL